MRDTLIYGNKDKSLEVSLILCSFSGIIVAGFPLGPMACLATGTSLFENTMEIVAIKWSLSGNTGHYSYIIQLDQYFRIT